jgi:DNA-directed RNA polymerase specialized sigma24 family protein
MGKMTDCGSEEQMFLLITKNIRQFLIDRVRRTHAVCVGLNELVTDPHDDSLGVNVRDLVTWMDSHHHLGARVAIGRACGKSTAEVAGELGVSSATCKRAVKRLKERWRAAVLLP